MIVFLDFEASSLRKDSYPIEIAWVFEDGRSTTRLIRPTPEWTDWSYEAEKIHGITRGLLMAQGIAVEDVAEEMLRELAGHDLFASAPSWDGKWLSTLLRGAGHPRHALRLAKSDEAFATAARDIMGETVPDKEIRQLVREVIAATEPPVSPAHRALPDAQLELERWQKVRRVAAERTQGGQRLMALAPDGQAICGSMKPSKKDANSS
ncbi:transcriptional regulator [Neorhizobium lilium]|uniref:3'-5' exonuclease n=1 Tax=Neorhizobium lilium TaxID=2503024 RepID=UPI001FE03717|nr:transcriptional regulator [Neorhizobium lilium]